MRVRPGLDQVVPFAVTDRLDGDLRVSPSTTIPPAAKSTALPPGKNSGQRWPTTPFSRRVSGCGAPPASETCWRAETFVGEKAIIP